MEICGLPPKEVLSLATRKQLFFDKNYQPVPATNSKGKQRLPSTKVI